ADAGKSKPAAAPQGAQKPAKGKGIIPLVTLEGEPADDGTPVRHVAGKGCRAYTPAEEKKLIEAGLARAATADDADAGEEK
ncbi:MAG: hypothetical protein AB1941_01925, partial [Gemmatimonadota bacterium]